ncbi:MAG: S1 RNA-binding domain-containing protein [Lachnospiraceae bacterium]|nr:S1 RNA-binding domain-containing protein [Lachnospiraceae bacterium]
MAARENQAADAEAPARSYHVEVGTDETMEDYKKELEASFKQVRVGDVMTGTVISVTEEGVTLDLNYYAPGFVRPEDVSLDPSFSLLNDVHVGDKMQATVVKKDDGAGNLLMSCVSASDTVGWERLQEFMNAKTVIPVKIAEAVNKGVVAYIENVRGFIPASQLSLSYVEEDKLPEYVGRSMKVRIINLEKDRKKMVLSAKDVLREEEKERVKQNIASLVPGTIMEGKVESLQPYGAFVDLGDGMTGLVHVSRISDKRIKQPSDVLKEGQVVKVKVLGVKDGKISLSIRDAMENAAAAPKQEKEKEEPIPAEYMNTGSLSSSLGDLLKGLKL